MSLIFIMVYAGIMLYGLYDIKHDKDYKVIQVKTKDYVMLFLEFAITSLIFININMWSALFLSMALPYMHLAAFTDKHTGLITFGWIYPVVLTGILAESMIKQHFSCYTLIPLALSVTIYLIKGYSKGDIVLSYLPAAGLYMYRLPDQDFSSTIMLYWTAILSLTVFCVMVVGAKEGNLKGNGDLKEAKPLGPYMLRSTYLVTIAYILLKEKLFL